MDWTKHFLCATNHQCSECFAFSIALLDFSHRNERNLVIHSAPFRWRLRPQSVRLCDAKLRRLKKFFWLKEVGEWSCRSSNVWLIAKSVAVRSAEMLTWTLSSINFQTLVAGVVLLVVTAFKTSVPWPTIMVDQWINHPAAYNRTVLYESLSEARL